MNEPKEFQQLVDRHLSRLQWNERQRQKVLHALKEERRTPYMKKKLTMAVALALTLCLVAGAALAATLVYSTNYNQSARADQLLNQQYGITENMLAFFTHTSHGNIHRYKSIPDLCGMPGDYVVDLDGGEVKWLFDGPTEKGWDAEKLSEMLQLRAQKKDYSDITTQARADANTLGLILPTPAPLSREEMDISVAAYQQRAAQAQAQAVITEAEAEALARTAIQQKYSLTDEQLLQMEYVPESTVYNIEGDIPVISPYFWLNQQQDVYTEMDGIYIVDVNVLDGAIESILYDSGLMGNG